MKRIFSLLLTISFTIMMLPQNISAVEVSEFTVAAGSNFNEADSLPDCFEDVLGTSTIDTQTYSDNPLYDNVVKLEGSSEGYPKLTCKFSDILPESANLYAETEFDMLTYGLKTAGAHVTFGIANKVKSIYIQNSGKMYAGTDSSGTFLGTADMTDTWMHFRIVMQITDSEGTKVNRILGIYQNGQLIAGGDDDVYAFNEDYAKYRAFSIQLSKKSGEYGVYIDNFAVCSYNSETGDSPVPDKLEYVKLIQELSSKLEANQSKLSEAEYTDFKTRIDSLLSVYSDIGATKTQVSSSLAESDVISDEIDAAVKKNAALPIERETVLEYNFNSLTDIPSDFTPSEDGAAVIDKETFSDDLLYQNVIKLNGSSESYNSILCRFTPIESIGKNVYAETEFDLNKYGMSESEANMTLRFGSKIMNMYVRASGSGGIYLGEDTSGEKIAESTGAEKWSRYRFVFRLTDENGDVVNKLVGIYENGVNIMINPQASYDFTQQNPYSTVSFNLSKKSGTYGIYIDNFSVTKYSSDDGISPVPHKNGLMEAITVASAMTDEADTTYTAEQKTKIQKSIDNGSEVFYNIASNQSSVDEAVALINRALNNGAVEINSFTVQTENGDVTNHITSGMLSKVTLSKNHEVAGNANIVVSIYDSVGRMTSCIHSKADLQSDTGSVDVPLSVSLPQDIKKGRVLISIWDDNNSPLLTAFDSEKSLVGDIAVEMNGFECKMYPAPEKYDDGELYVPAKYTANLFGIGCEENDGVYYAVSDYGTELSFTETTANVGANNYKAYLKQGIIMIPLTAFTDNFGCSALIDEFENTVVLSKGSGVVKTYGKPPADMISYNASEYSIAYSIACTNPEAQVEVWFMDNLWRTTNTLSLYWNKAHTPQYSDGAFHGGIAGLATSRQYKFRIKITDGDSVSIYEDSGCKTLAHDTDITLAESLYDTDGELLLNATYENISYYMDDETADTSCQVTWRKTGGSWNLAYEPVWDGTQWRGSITGLEENTEYEVKAVLKNSSGTAIKTKTAKITTKNSSPSIGQIIKISEINTGDEGLMLTNLTGSEDSWIKVINDSESIIDAGVNKLESVLINDCHYVIVEGLTVNGGYRYGINVSDNSSNVIIANCDISGWGRCGVLDESVGVHYLDGTSVNYDSGILLKHADDITVERCYIHNSNAVTNSWNSALWKDVHPQGGSGIYYSADTGVVIRYNDIIGNHTNRWNDAIEGMNNGSRTGGAARNCDIYGNMLYMGEDDGMELDGGQMNARVYKNRIEKFLCGISTAPNTVGPAYIFRNLIVNLGTSYNNRVNTAIKAGGTRDNVFGMQFYFNNTIDSNADGIKNSNYGGITEFHSVTRNNILMARGQDRYGFKNSFADERDNNDYDFISGQLVVKSGDEAHGILGYPVYVDVNNGNYHLSSASKGKSAGEYIDNFCEESKPDMGAFSAKDTNAFMPFRPVDMYADRYNVVIADGETQKINIHFGEISSDTSYKVLTDNEWITANRTNGVISANSDVEIILTADMSKAVGDECDGMVIIRLDNGYSIPITVQNK